MSIVHVMATIRCDGCNKPFCLTLDRTTKVGIGDDPKYSLDDLVRDHITSDISTSIQGEHLLCVDCTKFIDDAFPDDDVQPDYNQVCAALNERAGV